LTASWYVFWISLPRKEEKDDGKLRPIKQSHLPTLLNNSVYGGNSERHLKIQRFSILGTRNNTNE
jgi:hypothetical protein